jgi:hypothetical protein
MLLHHLDDRPYSFEKKKNTVAKTSYTNARMLQIIFLICVNVMWRVCTRVDRNVRHASLQSIM